MGLERLPSTFSSLYRLTDLNLSFNAFAQIPSSILGLRLAKLNLSNNELTVISMEFLKQPQTLNSLDFSFNKLVSLPPGLETLCRNTDVSHNPLTSIPPEIVAKGNTAILDYLPQLKDKAPWRRMKLLFVGEECVGKTSLRLTFFNSAKRKGRSKKKKGVLDTLAT